MADQQHHLDEATGLDVLVHKQWLARPDSTAWWGTLAEHVRWYRVKYKSARFGSECETPCYTAFYGGFDEFKPFAPVPDWLRPVRPRAQHEAGSGQPAGSEVESRQPDVCVTVCVLVRKLQVAEGGDCHDICLCARDSS